VSGSAAAKLGLLPNAQEHILRQQDGKNRLMKAVADLSKVFGLAVPHDEAMRIRDDVGFFQTVRTVIAKSVTQQHRPEQELDNAIRQIVSRAVFSGEVVDIFAAAWLKKPDISILSDEFLAEVRYLPQKNLAVEMLRKLLTNEIKTRSSRNVVKSRLFSELLEGSTRKYQNRAIQAAQVIEELVGLAKQMREETAKGEELGHPLG
jgi:type I restriction enzyme R subunit